MGDIADKLDSYQILSNLLSGAFFVTMVKLFYCIDLTGWNVGEIVITYYFVGFIISRFGSLVLEPLLKKVKWIEFAPYSDFLAAEKVDSKVTILSETNNYILSLLAATVLLPVFWLLLTLKEQNIWFALHWKEIFWIGAILLFSFSYRKQTSFVRSRVQAYKASCATSSSSDNPDDSNHN